MNGLNKNTLTAAGTVIAAVIVLLVFTVFKGGGENDSSAGDTSSLAVYSTTTTAGESAAPAEDSEPEGSKAEEKPAKSYKFRSQKLFDDHYKKHGSEFGDITQEEYLRLANELLNSDSETVLHKTEAEDGDDVFFDTETGYFLVLSTDGYIRTFFIPNDGIKYYERQ